VQTFGRVTTCTAVVAALLAGCADEESVATSASVPSTAVREVIVVETPASTTLPPITPEMIQQTYDSLTPGRDLEVAPVGQRLAEEPYSTLSPEFSGAPFLCVAVRAYNPGPDDSSINNSEFQFVNPAGQIVGATGDVSAFAAARPSLGASLAPGGEVVGEVCTATRGQTGSFELRWNPGPSRSETWQIHL
jgi:hypothetical protein